MSHASVEAREPEPRDPAPIVETEPGAQPARPGWHFPREGALWLLAAAVIFTTGLVKGINLLIFLAYILLGLWVINCWRVQSTLGRLRGAIWPAASIRAGKRVPFRLELWTPGRRPVRGVRIEHADDAGRRRWAVVNVGHDTPIRITYSRRFERRGRFTLEPLTAQSSYPFGLIGAVVALTKSMELIVSPRTGQVRIEMLRRWLSSATRGDGRVRRPYHSHLPAHLFELHGLRDFRPGDSPRWIHWRSSARRNQILVREFEDPAVNEIGIVLDPYLPEQPTSRDREWLEEQVSLAATICLQWCENSHAHLVLVILGKEPQVLAGRGSGRIQEFLEALAVAEGTPAPPDERWLDRVPRFASALPIVILSSRADTDVAGYVESRIGRTVARVNPHSPTPWYTPPAAEMPEAGND